MIPNFIDVVEQQPVPIEDQKLICECGEVLRFDNAFGYIDKDQLKEHISCQNCLKTKIISNQIIFSDTYDFFMKRKHSGFIEQLIREFKRSKNGKD